MIESLHIDGFRGFDDVRVDGLGQFNVIVGPGSVGKTNLLEALFLFCSNGDATLIPKILALRRIEPKEEAPKDLSALINWFWSVGRDEPFFEISGAWDKQDRCVRVSKLRQETEIPVRSPDAVANESEVRDALAVYQISSSYENTTAASEIVIMRNSVKMPLPTRKNIPGRFISPMEVGMSRPLASVWSDIEDREEQDGALALLATLDPDITAVRIAADEIGRAVLRVQHKKLGRMPVEFLGGGFGKALAVACYILAVRDGILVIDELDASLHVAAQRKVVDFLLRSAQKHNVQLFVSTHSLEMLDTFLDAYEDLKGLFNRRDGLRVLQLKRAEGQTMVTSIDADQAKGLREDIGLDLRRTT